MLDFDAEATRLRAALGLDTDHPGSTHHDMDKLWVDKRTGGAVYVGNETAAKMSVEQFQHFGIAGVVNCTDDMPNFIEGKPGAPSYMRFNVAWHTHVSGNPTNCAKFLGGFFAFVDAALDQGKSVLVHCLAGAHRAGTAGVLLLMHKDGLSAEDGIKAAQALRPIINPIGQLPLLLRRFEALREEAHRRVWAEAEEARQAQAARMIGRTETTNPPGRAATATAAATQQRAQQQQQQRAQAQQQQPPQPEEADEYYGPGEASLDELIEALNFIGRKADYLYTCAHEVHEALLIANEELPPPALTYRGAASGAPSGTEEDYEDDFEEDEDDEEEDSDEDSDSDDEDDEDDEDDAGRDDAAGRPVAGRIFQAAAPGAARGREHANDLAALRAAVEESRAAVASVEARLHAAEAEEPIREAAVAASRSPIHLLAASVASAMGVSQATAMQALANSGGSLEGAVDALVAEMQRR